MTAISRYSRWLGPVRLLAAAACALFALLVLVRPISAQDVAGVNLKAAYIYRFVPFAEWPADVLPPSAPLTICVVGDPAMRDALERTIKTAKSPRRQIVVAFGTPDKPPAPCHVLYVSGVSQSQASRLVTGVRDLPVLTMSDLEGFNRLGGITEFFFEAGQIRYSIRLDAVTQSHLQLSSQLLKLARPR